MFFKKISLSFSRVFWGFTSLAPNLNVFFGVFFLGVLAYGFVPDFDDAILGRSAALATEHTVEGEGGSGGRVDLLGTGEAALLAVTARRVLVHLVVIQPPERLVRRQHNLRTAVLQHQNH